MSALRQLLASLWAAIWLQWRLVGVRLRRLFRRGHAPAAGASGFQLAAAEVPVEGVDYELLEPPPAFAARLDDARTELLDHARTVAQRRSRRRRTRRRRTASLATAALLTLAVLGAGATALVTGSTGVPAIDRLLGIHEAGLEEGGQNGSDLQPRSTGESTSIETPVGPGGSIVTSFYVARDGDVCSAVTGTRGDEGSLGSVTCVDPRVPADALARDGGFVSALNTQADAVVVRGFVSDRVVDLEGRGPAGPLDVQLGESWPTGIAELGSVKPFVAVSRFGPDGPPSEAVDRARLLLRENYVFDAVTKDGDRLQMPR